MKSKSKSKSKISFALYNENYSDKNKNKNENKNIKRYSKPLNNIDCSRFRINYNNELDSSIYNIQNIEKTQFQKEKIFSKKIIKRQHLQTILLYEKIYEFFKNKKKSLIN